MLNQFAGLALSEPGQGCCLDGLPKRTLQRIALHLRDSTSSANPQADLLAFALTCKSVAAAVIPSVLYSHLQIPSLASLYSLESTLRINTHLASHVKVLLLSPQFMDWYQYDMDGVLSSPVKYNGKGSVPCALRLPFFGPTAERSLLMAWLSTLAQLCPNLVGVDLGPTVNMTKSITIGFVNLAEILRPRGGWFKSPTHERLPIASILVYSPPKTGKGSQRRVPVAYAVTAMDWGRKILDIENIPQGVDLLGINLCQIDTIIPGGSQELALWRVRDMKIFNFGDDDSPVPTSSLIDLGLHSQSYVFDLDKQRLLAEAPAHLSPSLSSTSTQSAKPSSGKGRKGKGKKGRGGRKVAKNPAKSIDEPTAVSSSSAPPQSSKFAGNVDIYTGPLHLALDILTKYNIERNQCVALRSSIDGPSFATDLMSMMYTGALTKAFHARFLNPLVSSPWLSVSRLDFGFPLFSVSSYTASLEALEPLARAFPNVTTLVLRLTDASITDVLISVDPFVRRIPEVGLPLRELAIVRNKNIGFGASITTKPPVSGFKRTILDPSKPTRSHLRKLVLEMTPDSIHESSQMVRVAVIHPVIAAGLETLIATGIRIGIAQPPFAAPSGPSFPSSSAMYAAGVSPIKLGQCTFPNLRHLHFTSKVELGVHAFPGSLLRILPTCPLLESLVLDANEYPFLADTFQVIRILTKYLRLRNAAIFPIEFLKSWLADLYLHFFGAKARQQRPLPHLARLIVFNNPDSNFPEWSAPGAWSIQPAGSQRLSDIPVPDESFKLMPSLLPNIDPLARDKGQLASQQRVLVPHLNRPCKCGKQVMGKAARPGTEIGAWVHAGDPKGATIVCRACVNDAAEKVDGRLRVEVQGEEVEFEEVRQIAGCRTFMDLYPRLGSAVWEMRI